MWMYITDTLCECSQVWLLHAGCGMSCIICTRPLCSYAGKQRLAEAGLLLRGSQARQVVQEGSCSFVVQSGVQRLEVVYLGGFCFACAGWA